MPCSRALRWSVPLFLLCFPASSLFAETIELVTYYPAPGGGNVDTGRLHADRATVGNPPYSLLIPADLPNGTLLVAGPLAIGTAAPLASSRLHVAGAGGQVSTALFMPGAGAGSEMRVGIGTTAPASVMHTVTEAADAANDFLWDSFSNDPLAGGGFITRRARGTPAAPADVAVGDDLGGMGFFGYRGGAFLEGAGIDPVVDNGPVVAGQIPAALSFFTGSTPNRLRITSTGNVGIGTAAPNPAASPGNRQATGNLDVNDVFLRSVNRWASQTPRITAASLAANRTYPTSTSAERVILPVTVITRGGPLLLLGKVGSISPGVASNNQLRIRRGGVTGLVLGRWSEWTDHASGIGVAHEAVLIATDTPEAGPHTYVLTGDSDAGIWTARGGNVFTKLIVTEY